MKNTIIFCSLFAMIYWFQAQTKISDIVHNKNQPQEYMTNLHVTNFAANGEPKETMQAEYWEFVRTEGHSDLTNPQVTIYKPNGEIWHLRAKHAIAWHPTINDKISKVMMSDGVVIERENEPVIVKTLNLQYLPGEETISTQQFVELEQPGLIISGYGLHGNLNNNRIELHDKITTTYTTQ